MTPDLNTVVDVLLQYVRDEVAPLAARLDAVEQRLADPPAVKFRGAWRDGESYRPGEAVVRAGSLWIAERATTPSDIPGVFDEEDQRGPWRLAAKGGKDAGRKLDRIANDLETRVRRLEQHL